MLVTLGANCARHGDGETGYLICGGSVGRQSDRRGLAPQDEEKRCSRVWYPAKREQALVMLEVGTEEEKKARQKATRWGTRLVESFIDHSSISCPFLVISLNVCAEVDGQPHALRCLQSESHQMITSQPTGSVLRKHGMPSLTALIWMHCVDTQQSRACVVARFGRLTPYPDRDPSQTRRRNAVMPRYPLRPGRPVSPKWDDSTAGCQHNVNKQGAASTNQTVPTPNAARHSFIGVQ